MGQYEDLGEQHGRHWSVNWDAARFYLAAGHPAFLGDAAPAWEVGEALRQIAGWKNEESSGSGGNLLMAIGRAGSLDASVDPDDLDDELGNGG